MAKGVFQYIANRIFDCVGNSKVITCGLLIQKLLEHLSMDCDVLECEKDHILFKVDLCGDEAMYMLRINERNCVECVEFIGIVGE